MPKKMTPKLKSDISEELKLDHDVFRASVEGETHRGAAVVTAAFVEECLETMLRTHFHITKRNNKSTDLLFEGFGPLSSFSGKISLCYSFSLIDEALEHDLHIIRKIRNEFAHSIETKDFGDHKIAQMVDHLRGSASYIPSVDTTSRIPSLLTYLKFVYASGSICGFLHSKILLLNSGEAPVAAEMFAKFFPKKS